MLSSLSKRPLCPIQNVLRPPALKRPPAHLPKKFERIFSNFFSEIYSENLRPPPFGQQKKRPMAAIKLLWISHFFISLKRKCRDKLRGTLGSF